MNHHGSRGSAFIAAALFTLAGPLRPGRCEAAAPPAARSMPTGAVDGAPFALLATDDDDLVEVDLRPSLLRALSKSVSVKDQEGGRVLAELSSVRAVIVGLTPQKVDAAVRQIEATAAALRAKGWEELARIRDQGARIRVLVLNDQDRIAGLTVLMVDRKGGDDNEKRPQLVFANITGPFDLADLGKLTSHLDVPGLATALGALPDAGAGKAP